MKMPGDDALRIAIAWLEANEGDDEEGAACREVLQWIEHELNDRLLRRESRAAGIPVAVLRRKLAGKAFTAGQRG
jgi:hypothetical protein